MWPTLAIVDGSLPTTGATCCARRCAWLNTHLAYDGPRARDCRRRIGRRHGRDAGRVPRRCADVVSPRRGLPGANANAGVGRTRSLRADYVLQLQDDMHLLTTLDMHPHIERLRDDPTCGFIRLWGVGGIATRAGWRATTGACSGIATSCTFRATARTSSTGGSTSTTGCTRRPADGAHRRGMVSPGQEPRRARREADRRICTRKTS